MSVPGLDGFVDVLARATLALALAGTVACVLRRRSAATRHLVWTLGIAAALLLPALRGVAPRLELPLLPTAPTVVRIELPRLDRATASAGHAGPMAASGVTATAPAGPLRTRVGAGASRPQLDPAALMTFAWLAGALLVAAPLLIGTLRVWRHGRRHGAFGSPEWADLLRQTSGSLALTRAVRLLRGRPRSMPMAWGLLRPAVVLPEDAEAWPAERRRTVLMHELGHVKRHDCLTQALAQVACAVYWFHPLAWVAAWRLRVERERACDDLVLAAGASGPDYADHLLQLARGARAAGGPAWALAMARPSQLEGRLLAILDPSLERRGPTRAAAAAALALAASLALLLAGIEPWVRPAAASTTLALDTLGADSVGADQAAGAAVADAKAGPVEAVAAPAAAPAVQATPSADSRPVLPTAAAPQPRGGPKPEVVAALADAVRDPDPDVRRQAVHSLGELRAQGAVKALAAALADEDAEVRAQAAFALGQIRAESAVAALSAALRDKDAEVRQQVVFALGELRAHAATEGLTAALSDSEAQVRGQAAFALGELRAEAAVGPLSRTLKDAEADVRKQAAFALGEIRSPQAVPALVEALKDHEPEVRGQAAFALGEIRDARASEALMAALKDATADVRRQAAFALGQIAGEDGDPSSNPNPNPNPNPQPRQRP